MWTTLGLPFCRGVTLGESVSAPPPASVSLYNEEIKARFLRHLGRHSLNNPSMTEAPRCSLRQEEPAC